MKNRAKKAEGAVEIDVPPTPEFTRHFGPAVEVYTPRGTSKTRVRNTVQNPLDYYRKKKLITYDQFRAGERLYGDFYQTGTLKSLVLDLDRSGGVRGMSKSQAESYLRFREAMLSVSGSIGKIIVFNVCCLGETIESMGTLMPYKNSNQRMARLHEGIDELVIHYKNLFTLLQG